MLSYFLETIHCFLLDILNNSYNINILTLNIVILVLPVIVLFWKFACNTLLIQNMQLIIFLSKSDVIRTFVVYVLQAFDIVAFAQFKFSLLS